MIRYINHFYNLDTMRPHLDLSAVEAFVLVADLRSFTHAAEALD